MSFGWGKSAAEAIYEYSRANHVYIFICSDLIWTLHWEPGLQNWNMDAI